MVERAQLLNYLNELLAIEQFNDYCPNGLQVEGKKAIKKIISGVSAGQDLLDQAVEQQADAILVHHGYFWRGEAEVICDMEKRRLATLLNHDINLFAYHLPLDAHATYGNNVQLAKLLDINVSANFTLMGLENMGWIGQLAQPLDQQALSDHIRNKLQRTPLWIDGGAEKIQTIAWCSGGAQDGIIAAAAQGVDAYLSGEISERTFYQAKELKLHYISAGHHATERGGVIALGNHLAEKFDLQHQFIDCDNPV
ncbi:MAG: Nif3-like dinuclear metal center hexameric protein [Gammaproteobacteria bacterium]|nr:Nif3-like dinuclear metal center hexameric protein [Gammaproteobacteria bacterium]